MRAALGASRASLLSQSLTESLLLSFVGAGVGPMGAQWGVNLLVAAIPESQLQAMPYLRNAGINLAVLLFLCGVTVLTGILFGLAPGLEASRASLNDALKDESRGGTSTGHAGLRNTLVVAEISISLVLLVGAGLLLKSLLALLGQDPGFNLHNVLTFSVNLPDSSYPSDKTPPYYSAVAVRFDHEFTEPQCAGCTGRGSPEQLASWGQSGRLAHVLERGSSAARCRNSRVLHPCSTRHACGSDSRVEIRIVLRPSELQPLPRTASPKRVGDCDVATRTNVDA